MSNPTPLTAWLEKLTGYRIAELEGSSPGNSHKRKRTLLKRAAELQALAKAEGWAIEVRRVG